MLTAVVGVAGIAVLTTAVGVAEVALLATVDETIPIIVKRRHE